MKIQEMWVREINGEHVMYWGKIENVDSSEVPDRIEKASMEGKTLFVERPNGLAVQWSMEYGVMRCNRHESPFYIV